MSRQLARNLYHLLRGAGRPTSLTKLRRDGYARVPVLRFSELESLIAEAVESTLQRLGTRLSEADLAKLNEEARVEFLALIQERDSLRSTVDNLLRQQEELLVHQDTLRGQIDRTSEELQREEQGVRPSGGAAAPALELDDLGRLEQQLVEGLVGLLLPPGEADAGGERAALADRAAAFVRTTLGAHRRHLEERLAHEREDRIDRLQRRIGKLSRKLGETEELLSKARTASDQSGATFSMGPGAPTADKKGLLDEIFKLNVELKKMIADDDGA